MHEHESKLRRKLYKITDTVQEVQLCQQQERSVSGALENRSSNTNTGKGYH